MSQKGLKIAADVFSHMQKARQELIALGSRKGIVKTESGKQDILLGQMFQDGNDAIKVKFANLTMMETSPRKKRKK